MGLGVEYRPEVRGAQRAGGEESYRAAERNWNVCRRVSLGGS